MRAGVESDSQARRSASRCFGRNWSFAAASYPGPWKRHVRAIVGTARRGGIEPGETPFEAVVRELQEEIGLRVNSLALNPPTWHRDVIYTYRGERRLQHEVIFLIRLNDFTPPVVTTQRVGFEREDHFESRWWIIKDVASNKDRFYPRSLPFVIERLLEGEQIHEDLEVWD